MNGCTLRHRQIVTRKSATNWFRSEGRCLNRSINVFYWTKPAASWSSVTRDELTYIPITAIAVIILHQRGSRLMNFKVRCYSYIYIHVCVYLGRCFWHVAQRVLNICRINLCNKTVSRNNPPLVGRYLSFPRVRLVRKSALSFTTLLSITSLLFYTILLLITTGLKIIAAWQNY